MFLVTGGAGFIGSHIVERLVRDGKRVRMLDSRQLAASGLPSDVQAAVEAIEGDIRDAEIVRRATDGVEITFHQAAISSVQRSVEDPRTTMAVNVDGTLNVLEAAREAGCRRVVFASSAAVYGDSPELPKIETMLPRPLSPYAVSKVTGEHLCAVYWHLHGLETVALRYFNVYGPRQDPSSPYSGVISRFADAIQKGEPVTIYGDGEQTRDFVYVDDVVKANLLAAEAEGVSGEVFNIGSGVATSLNELLAVMAKALGGDIHADYQDPRPGDIRESVGDVSAAELAFRYLTRVSLEDGLADLFSRSAFSVDGMANPQVAPRSSSGA